MALIKHIPRPIASLSIAARDPQPILEYNSANIEVVFCTKTRPFPLGALYPSSDNDLQTREFPHQAEKYSFLQVTLSSSQTVATAWGTKPAAEEGAGAGAGVVCIVHEELASRILLRKDTRLQESLPRSTANRQFAQRRPASSIGCAALL